MECPQCGHENRDVAQFCQQCGAALAALSPSVAAGDETRPKVTSTTEDTTSPAGGDVEPIATADTVEEPESPGTEDCEPEPAAEAPTQQDLSIVEGEAEQELTQQDSEVTAISSVEAGTPANISDDQDAVQREDQDSPSAQERDIPSTAQTPVQEDGTLQDAQEEGDEDLVSEPLAEAEDVETLVPVEETSSAAADSADTLIEFDASDLLPWRDGPPSVGELAAGTVVCGRYQISETLSVEEGETLYRVRDLQRCPQCGFSENSPDQAFCTSCGATMDHKPSATMLERPIERQHDPVEAEAVDHFTDQGRAYWVWTEAIIATTDRLSAPGGPMRIVYGQRSDNGQVRELDEDSLFVLVMSRTHESIEEPIALFVVADGMGGHEGGEVASKIAIQTLAHKLLQNVLLPTLDDVSLDPEMIQEWMRRAVEAANDQVYLERQKRQNDMGTTISVILLREWTVYLAHVGDCRAYRWSEDGLEQLTTDHSIVASMVALGTVRPEEVYTHPQRSVIYRCIGDQPQVEVDTAILPLTPGDRLVLCCDGLWEMLHDEGIEEVMLRESDPQVACETMVEQANMAGGPDNISVIVVQL